MKIENYPQQIIPKLSYKGQINLTKIKKHQSAYLLVRRSLKDHNNTFDTLGILRRDALIETTSKALGLSMYFVNNIHHSEYIKYGIFDSAIKYWSEGQRIRFSDYQQFIKMNSPICPVYFRLSDIDGKRIPYQKNIDKKKKKEMLEKLDIDEKSLDDFEYSGVTEIEHKPVILNYWHIEFKILKDKKIENGTEIRDIKNAWRRKLVEHSISNILIVNAKKEVTFPYTNHMPSKEFKLNFKEILLRIVLPRLKSVIRK